MRRPVGADDPATQASLAHTPEMARLSGDAVGVAWRKRDR